MASTASVTFISYNNYTYTSEQGTPFVFNIITNANASSLDPIVSSPLPPPPPPNASDGGFDNLNYYTTGYVVLDNKKSRVTTVTSKGPDHIESSRRRELKLKIFNKGYSETESNNPDDEESKNLVYFKVNAAELLGSFTYLKIVDSSDNVTDVIESSVAEGNISFSLPRMTTDTA